MKDYYLILGVPPDATLQQIKDARHNLLQFLHPDKWVGDPDMRRRAEEKAKEINAAYDVLSDPLKRARYDLIRPSGSSYRGTTQRDDTWRRAQDAARRADAERMRREQAERDAWAQRAYRMAAEQRAQELRRRQAAEAARRKRAWRTYWIMAILFGLAIGWAILKNASEHRLALSASGSVQASTPPVQVHVVPTQSPAAPTQVPTPTTQSPTPPTGTRALAVAGVTRNADWEPYIAGLNRVQMALVPAGCFQMGSADGDSDERPIHQVCFDAPYWIDVYEVTQAQFAMFDGQAVHASYFTGDNLPRESITWAEASAFCEKRGARLLTEAEWEYAARGPDDLVYPWGNNWNGDLVVRNTDQTAPVGSKLGGVSWIGAFDLSGNVWEWVNDWYGSYSSERQVNPQGPASGDYRVLRGGSWNNADSGLRGAERNRYDPDSMDGNLGFRCTLSY